MVILDALAASAADLAAGLLAVAGIAFILLLARSESKDARHRMEMEVDDGELAEVWNFPPKWSPPCAESDLGSERERAA